jgi:flavin-binding protein dodecin
MRTDAGEPVPVDYLDPPTTELAMANHVYKTIELTGTSTSSFEDAVSTAIGKAAATIREMRWFQVTETRGFIKDGRIDHWQVTVDVGFALE